MLTTIISTPFMYSDADMISASLASKYEKYFVNFLDQQFCLVAPVPWRPHRSTCSSCLLWLSTGRGINRIRRLGGSGNKWPSSRWTPERNRFNDNNRITCVYICQWSNSVTLRLSTAAMRSLMITKWSFRSFSGPPHSKCQCQIPELCVTDATRKWSSWTTTTWRNGQTVAVERRSLSTGYYDKNSLKFRKGLPGND